MVDTQGFRITINENPPMLKFGVFLKITYFGRGDRKKEREKRGKGEERRSLTAIAIIFITLYIAVEHTSDFSFKTC